MKNLASHFFPFTLIWQRYFVKEMLKVFFLFLFCFFLLYVLIDFSSHAGSFHHHHVKINFQEMAFYYVCDFIRRLDVLIPFAILLATIRTLCGLNVNNELVAMMANGIKLKTLLRPFILISLFFVMVVYLNSEFFLPAALKKLKEIDESRSSQKKKTYQLDAIQHLILEDGSTFIFQNYVPSEHYFYDVYWIRNIDDIYHFKFLYPHLEVPKGISADHFNRGHSGNFEHVSFSKELPLPELRFDSAVLMDTLTTPEELSLSELSSKQNQEKEAFSEKQAQILSIYYYKMAIPWLCLLAVIGPAPFCVRYTRYLPQFFIYAGGLFGLVAIYLIFDAALILGKRQAIDPFLAIALPFLLFFALFGYRYVRLQT